MSVEIISRLACQPNYMSNPKMAWDGDSWPGYPKLLGGNLATYTAEAMGCDLVNNATNGNSSEETNGLKNIIRLRSILPGVDFFGISSGGDDFAGDQFRECIQDFKPSMTPMDGIDWAWFKFALALIIEDYKELTALRDELCPNAWILTHSYGYPPASMMGVGVKIAGITAAGPWLQPGFIDRGWLNPADQAAMVKMLLMEFERQLSAYAATNRKHIHSNFQSVLMAYHFANELHLISDGWRLCGQTINGNYINRIAREPRTRILDDTDVEIQ